MAENTSATKVVTGEVRLSYVHLWEPYSSKPDQEAKYSVALLIPKEDKATLSKIRKAQAAALEQGLSKFGGKKPPNLKNTLRDGDEEMDLEKNPEYAGHYFMNVNSKTKPGIVDRAVKPIEDSSEVYSGCYARVSINAFAYNTSGNKGISFGLNHVQKLRDGDFLGGRSKAEDDFDEVEPDDGDLFGDDGDESLI
jgi:hypothetical protein